MLLRLIRRLFKRKKKKMVITHYKGRTILQSVEEEINWF